MSKMTTDNNKIVIYQMLVRLFGNTNPTRRVNGTLAENGCGKMNDITASALRSIRQLGCNWVWYTGLLQQATQTDWSAIGLPRQNPHVVKGVAGSPYAITDYYSISPDLAENPSGRMAEFDALVERTHKAKLKLIIDFVPNHVARQYHSTLKPANVRDLGQDDDTSKAFSPQNNFYYIPGTPFAPWFDLGSGEGRYVENPARVTGNDCFTPSPGNNDWYETVKLNYGIDYQCFGQRCFDPVPSTWIKMRDILLYWAGKGVDGFRCDMAHMVPVEFWQWAISQVKKAFPGVIFIAEIYEPAIYRAYIGAGFDYLYDKVGLYDTLKGVIRWERPASDITGCWQALGDIQEHMLNFLENHDEQRIASGFFAGSPEKAFPGVAVGALMGRSPYMIYFGQELGERGMDEEGYSGRDGRTTIFDYWSLPKIAQWHGSGDAWSITGLGKEERKVRGFYRTLFGTVAAHPVFTSGKFFDLEYRQFDNPDFDTQRLYAFLRYDSRERALVVANFSPTTQKVKVRIPREAWDELKVRGKKLNVTDLFSGGTQQIPYLPEEPLDVTVGPDTVTVLMF